MNLNTIRAKANARIADMQAGIYSPIEVEQFLRGMIAVLLCSDAQGAVLLAASLNREVTDMQAAQGKAA